MKMTKRTIRDYDTEVCRKPHLIFDKICKCGNRLGITLTKDNAGTEVQVTEKDDFSPTCFMVGNSTCECNSCHRRYRSYHHAYMVEARLEA